jgi:hypothetical protein
LLKRCCAVTPKVSRNSKETLLPPAWKSTDLTLALIGGIAMTLMKETAPVKVGLAPGH